MQVFPHARPNRLLPRHLPRHVEQKPPVGFAHGREQSSEFLPEVDFFAVRAPRDLGRELPLGKMRQQRAFLSLTAPHYQKLVSVVLAFRFRVDRLDAYVPRL
jgi:hypothetical protein